MEHWNQAPHIDIDCFVPVYIPGANIFIILSALTHSPHHSAPVYSSIILIKYL